MKKILILSVILLSSMFAEQLGTLIKKEGLVKVKHPNSIRKVSLKINDPINNGDMVYTYKSIAVVELNDSSIIKLTPYSQIEFNSSNRVNQKKGKIYFHIHKRKTHKLAVATAFTTIGVKGTTFIVDEAVKHSVSLKEGVLKFKSLSGKYELHKKSLLNQFKNFVKKGNNEFDKYNKNLNKEFKKYTQEFELQANHTVAFDGNKVIEKKMDKKELEEFSKFEKKFKLINFDSKDHSKPQIKNKIKETNSSVTETNSTKIIPTKKLAPKKIKNDFVIKVRNPKTIGKTIEEELIPTKKPSKNSAFNELDEE